MKLFLIAFFVLFLPFTVLPQADTVLIRKHVTQLSQQNEFRNYINPGALNSSSEYIMNVFKRYADTSYFQTFNVSGVEYRNVIAVFGPRDAGTIVIGAHYDVCGNQPGADDNASGVSALLEVARLLSDVKPVCRIELVAYSLEEPPFFKTENMGSYVHASSLYSEKRRIIGMICFDLIGYYSDVKGSQDYPLPLMSLLYGKKGDYVTIVNKFSKGRFARKFTRKFKRNSEIRAKKFTGFKTIPGVDFSDHLNYWKFGYSACFITNTAFYRNKNYHTTLDTADKLDYKKMAAVINSVFKVLQSLDLK